MSELRFELIDKDGISTRTASDIATLAETAKLLFPNQPQDPDRTGAGWDVQVVGAE